MSWQTELAGDIAGWMWAESSLGMMAKSARAGFAIPWAGSLHGKFGLRTKGFGAIGATGKGATKAQRALSMFEKGGIRGYARASEAVTKKFGKKFATQVGSKVGQRYLLGRAAGIALKGANVALWGFLAYDLVAGGIGIAYDLEKKYKGLELGGNFQDSLGGSTSRQRALRAITASSLQARSAIGNEAMLMHR